MTYHDTVDLTRRLTQRHAKSPGRVERKHLTKRSSATDGNANTSCIFVLNNGRCYFPAAHWLTRVLPLCRGHSTAVKKFGTAPVPNRFFQDQYKDLFDIVWDVE